MCRRDLHNIGASARCRRCRLPCEQHSSCSDCNEMCVCERDANHRARREGASPHMCALQAHQHDVSSFNDTIKRSAHESVPQYQSLSQRVHGLRPARGVRLLGSATTRPLRGRSRHCSQAFPQSPLARGSRQRRKRGTRGDDGSRQQQQPASSSTHVSASGATLLSTSCS